MNRSHVIDPETKSRGATPRNAMALDTLAGVRSKMSRLYRLALNGRIRSDEMTRFIYALKEIRARLGADRRATATGLAVARHGKPQWSTRLSSTDFRTQSTLIEKRSQQNRPLKVVTVRRGYEEDPDSALDRHYAAPPEDRGANIVILEFYDEEEMVDESQVCTAPAGPACEKTASQDVSDAGRVPGAPAGSF